MAQWWSRYLRSDRPTRRRVIADISLPDFRNVGVILRMIVIAEGLRFLAQYVQTADLHAAAMGMVAQGSMFEAVLLSLALGLFFLSPRLAALSYGLGVGLVLALALALAFLWWLGLRAYLGVDSVPDLSYVVVVTAAMSIGLLGYFNRRHRVLSPALAEARLMGLQSRIRPHFLFNSLNTVLALIRDDAAKAERILENLADLFRSLLGEAGTLVPLRREVDLARSYAEIEAMRLGPRLTVDWQVEEAALDALVPPLFLQPLLENAVYHGVEPSESGGTVVISIFRRGEQVHVAMRNPHHPERVERRSGNRMALNNIRERLALHFDLEAELRSYAAGGEFVVHARVPYKHG